jgi:HlyD family secretion protein
MLRRWLTGLVVLALLAGVGWWAFAPRPVRVSVVEATVGSVTRTVDEEGKTRVRDRYVVSAPLGGRLGRITLLAGDRVERDAVVASITPPPPQLLDARTRAELGERVGAAEANLERARAALARSRASEAQAGADVARTESLQRQGFVSAAQVERDRLAVELARREVAIAASQLDAAEHDLAQARAALAGASPSARRRDGEQFPVRAPVAGQVLRLVQQSEAVVTPGTPLLEIGDPREIEIAVDVLSSDAVAIAPGAEVDVERWGGAEAVTGRVRRVEPRAFTKVSALGVEEQRVSVIVDVVRAPESWSRVGDGYRVLARMRTASVAGKVVVPVGALVRSRDGWEIFVVEGSTVAARPVRIALRNATHVAIEDGVRASERVVVYPPSSLAAGKRVRVEPGPR